MNRRGFLGALAGAVLSVALDVLPRFGLEEEAYSTEWTAIIVAQMNLTIIEPWRTGIVRGYADQFTS